MGTINLLENICSFGVLLLRFILRSRAAFGLGLIIPSGYSPWGRRRVRYDLVTKQLFPIVSASPVSASHSTHEWLILPMSHEVFQSGWREQLGIAPFNLSRWFLQISAVMSHASSLRCSVLRIPAVWVSPYPSSLWLRLSMGSARIPSLCVVARSFFKALSQINCRVHLIRFLCFRNHCSLLPMSYALKTIISYACPLFDLVGKVNLVPAIQSWPAVGVSGSVLNTNLLVLWPSLKGKLHVVSK